MSLLLILDCPWSFIPTALGLGLLVWAAAAKVTRRLQPATLVVLAAKLKLNVKQKLPKARARLRR